MDDSVECIVFFSGVAISTGEGLYGSGPEVSFFLCERSLFMGKGVAF